MRKISGEDGFSIVEMMVSTTVMLLVVGGALTTFKNAVQINDAASQLGDSTQNLRAGTNLLVRDLMMAGRIFGAEGVALPTCTGALPFRHPGPPLPGTPPLVPTWIPFTTVAVDGSTMNLPSITTGNKGGPIIKGSPTDMVTILTVDEFMPVIVAQASPSVDPKVEGTIATNGQSVTLAANSPWLVKDLVEDTLPMKVGDLVLFKSPNGNAIQTITRMDTTHIYFDNNADDPFRFNQSCAAPKWPMFTIRNGTTFTAPVTLFRATMITYYVDNSTTPGTPRLTRQINNFPSMALAGVVEDLDLTYDLVDGVFNPSAVPSLPWTDTAKTPNLTYNSNQIRKVNVHVGVRSEFISKPTQDYVRNHITTSVDVRSLASVDRYKVAGEVH